MQFSELASLISQENECIVNEGNSSRELTHFAFLSENMIIDDPSCLYIGKVNRKKLHGEMEGKCFLTPTRNLSKGISFICIPESEMMNCMNVLTSAFFRISDTEKRFAKLKESFTRNTPLDELINKAALFLDRSILFIDLGFKVISYSTSVSITDNLWKKFIKRGACTSEFINAMNELMPVSTMPGSSEAFKVNCSVSTEERLCSQVFVERRPAAYLVILDNNKGILPFHREYLAKVSDLLAFYVSENHNISLLSERKAEESFVKLLDADKNEEKDILSTFPEIKEGSFCIVIRARHHSRHELFFIKQLVEAADPMEIIFTYRELVVIVTNNHGIIEHIRGNGELLSNASEIGISADFERAEDFPKCFQNAQEACRIGKQIGAEEKIHYYEKYRFYQILNHVSDVELLRDYIHPALLTLHRYDIEHSTKFVETLKEYLAASCSVKEAAKNLFLHRNTMNYRIGKIEELTDIDFDDIETVFRLQCSYKINAILHMF